jgi:hypothetical protein
MDLSDDGVQQRAEADRRETSIRQSRCRWRCGSKASQLDWWVKERREWWDRAIEQCDPPACLATNSLGNTGDRNYLVMTKPKES